MRAIRWFGSTVVLGFALAGSLAAQEASAPKDATGQCTDGSYTTAKTEAKGCLKHGGVKSWYGGTSAAAASAPSASSTATAAPEPTPNVSASAGTQPKDATGQCTDGSYTTAKTQAKGCLKHGGVKSWYGASSAAAASSPSPTATAAPQPAPNVSASTKSQPKDATGQCTDGSYTTAKTQARGCLKHGGVRTWYGGETATLGGSAAPSQATAAPTTASTAAPVRASTAASVPAQAPENATDVWVNTSTKAYHCPGTKYYGATKHGKYMSEADAKAAGFHASYHKACGS